MKKCQNCRFENTDLMNFCMECGTGLVNNDLAEPKTVVFTDQKTAEYPASTPPTNPTTVIETQTQVRSRYNPPPPPNTVVQNQYFPPPNTPPPNKGNSKMVMIAGGLLALAVLLGVGVVGIVAAFAYFSQREVVDNSTPTPISTRTNERTTPTQVPLKETPTPADGSTPVGEFDDLWVDYNVREGGKLGMKVHINFTAKNMKDLDSYLAIYLQKNDGTAIYGKTPGFVAKTKQVAAFKLLRPAFDPAEYKDTQIFIPYTAFGLGRGTHNLQLNVNLIYKTDGLINQLTVYDFEFEQK